MAGHGTIDVVITLLWYLVVAALIAGVVFAVTLVVFGRGEQLSPLPPRTSPSQLPEAGRVEGEDVKALRLGVALRGYRMSDVDWTLDRLAEELELVRAERDRLRDQVVDLGGDPTPPEPVVAPVPAEEARTTDVEGESVTATVVAGDGTAEDGTPESVRGPAGEPDRRR